MTGEAMTPPANHAWPGAPYPLGATWDGQGVNFALWSERASAVELCLFDTDDTFLILLNASADPVHFVLPDAHPGDGWQAVVDTAVAPGSGPPVLDVGGTVSVVGRSLLLLRACSARE
ncbi:MAG: hypothetical protein A2X51_00500 [Candidatus Rokubacteria bacterium GWC2_70_24]|nr:MAG: hypothetical protein A2X51_00500 [Candidatus Rokubacteria bacterium GWC2_70_24]OGK93609.1 MAG: hypothetical protein A2X50_09845 [Candidatus Rokubacteria bacterium GWF2_70_14]